MEDELGSRHCILHSITQSSSVFHCTAIDKTLGSYIQCNLYPPSSIHAAPVSNTLYCFRLPPSGTNDLMHQSTNGLPDGGRSGSEHAMASRSQSLPRRLRMACSVQLFSYRLLSIRVEKVNVRDVHLDGLLHEMENRLRECF